jgi:predicted DNA-binding WGR domain protein
VEVYFENTNPPHRKFYRIWLEPSLIDVAMRRQWGRIGSKGRVMSETYGTWSEAMKAFQRLHRLRLSHGYRELGAGGRS